MNVDAGREPQLNMRDPLPLPPTARLLVETAKKMIVEKGYSWLSIERLTSECGVSKTAVRYYFSDKAGLLVAVIESVVHDQVTRVRDDLAASAGRERLHGFLAAKQAVSENADLFRIWIELLPEISRDAELSRRATELYEWLIDAYAEFFGLDAGDEAARGLAQLILGAVDGLGLQHLVNPDALDVGAAYAALERLLDAGDPTA